MHEPDITLSLACLERSVRLGCQEALAFVCSHGSGLISQKKAPADIACQWYMIAAKHGNIKAQKNLGYGFLNGTGVEQNFQKSFEWSMKAAEQGDMSAQNNLALCYCEGFGVEKDYKKGLDLFLKLAEKRLCHGIKWTGLDVPSDG